MKKIAVITGASSGLGKEYTRQIVSNDQLEEVWIIARRENLLDEIRQELGPKIRPVPMDLTLSEEITRLKELYAQEQPDIRFLINCAGMGRIGLVKEQALSDTDRMIDLNCRALADVTEISLPYMHKGAEILEISSIASFQPMPGFASYGATKAFVSSYSKALHHELLTSGIHVTAVCPYWIKDTSFIPIAKEAGHKGYRHTFLASHAKSVVRISLRDAKLNLWVSTPGIVCTLDRIAAKIIPHCLMTPLMDLVRHI